MSASSFVNLVKVTVCAGNENLRRPRRRLCFGPLTLCGQTTVHELLCALNLRNDRQFTPQSSHSSWSRADVLVAQVANDGNSVPRRDRDDAAASVNVGERVVQNGDVRLGELAATFMSMRNVGDGRDVDKVIHLSFMLPPCELWQALLEVVPIATAVAACLPLKDLCALLQTCPRIRSSAGRAIVVLAACFDADGWLKGRKYSGPVDVMWLAPPSLPRAAQLMSPAALATRLDAAALDACYRSSRGTSTLPPPTSSSSSQMDRGGPIQREGIYGECLQRVPALGEADSASVALYLRFVIDVVVPRVLQPFSWSPETTTLASLAPGSVIDLLDTVSKWYHATVLSVITRGNRQPHTAGCGRHHVCGTAGVSSLHPSATAVSHDGDDGGGEVILRCHYNGWGNKWDEDVALPSPRVELYGSRYGTQPDEDASMGHAVYLVPVVSCPGDVRTENAAKQAKERADRRRSASVTTPAVIGNDDDVNEESDECFRGLAEQLLEDFVVLRLNLRHSRPVMAMSDVVSVFLESSCVLPSLLAAPSPRDGHFSTRFIVARDQARDVAQAAAVAGCSPLVEPRRFNHVVVAMYLPTVNVLVVQHLFGGKKPRHYMLSLSATAV